MTKRSECLAAGRPGVVCLLSFAERQAAPAAGELAVVGGEVADQQGRADQTATVVP